MSRDEKSLLVLFGLAGLGAWLYFSRAGQSLITATSSTIESGVEKLADITNSTLNLIKSYEGFSSKPYPDARGWSIGYGHFMGTQPTMQEISESVAYGLLRNDVQTSADAIRAAVKVPLTQNQFDALASLAYNIGANAFRNSTLVRLLNAGDYDGAVAQFAVWRNSSGKVNKVLVQRRADEAAVFIS